MEKTAAAHWSGDIRHGQGTISTDTGVLREVPYDFNSRFGHGRGTSPEELIAAAHASCFSMALSLGLGNAGFTADSIDTRAAVTLIEDGDRFSITAVALRCNARVPDIDEATFERIAQATRQDCPVSRVLVAKISLEARLEREPR